MSGKLKPKILITGGYGKIDSYFVRFAGHKYFIRAKQLAASVRYPFEKKG